MTIRNYLSLILALLAPLVVVQNAPADGAAIADESDGRNWYSYGRTYSEQRFSPLGQINADNADRLGPHMVAGPARRKWPCLDAVGG